MRKHLEGDESDLIIICDVLELSTRCSLLKI